MTRRKEQDGQILVLFVVVLILLLAMAALAIDVSNVYATRRAYRTAADAAALAGGQELQQGLTKSLGTAQYAAARARAAEALGQQLGGTPVCDTVGTTMTCTFGVTPYVATIRTPINAGECVSCRPARSVEVKVANPAFAVSFARLFGIDSYAVSVGAVAGLSFANWYVIQTLRPPLPLGNSDAFDVRDIRIDGGTTVSVQNGDVGSNSNMEYAGTNSILQLDPEYDMYYYDNPFNYGPQWGTDPVGEELTALMEDPGYTIPSRTNAPTGVTVTADTDAACRARVDALLGDEDYEPLVPTDNSGAVDYTKVDCYSKGVYPSASNGPEAGVGNGRLGILEPGVYFFDGRFTVQGSLVGGYEGREEGVALVFSQSGEFKNRTSGGGSGPNAVVLNAGSRYGDPAGFEATPARDYSNPGTLVQTDTTPPLILTIMVSPDLNCVIGTTYPTLCDDNHNRTINLAGGTSLYLAGVQYAPSDNSVVAGGSDGNGYVGQIVSWTLRYTGGTQINQQGPEIVGPGLLRLDGACTAPGTPCAP